MMTGPWIESPAADRALPPHPLIDAPGTCGAVKAGASGIEWICIAEVHATETDIRLGRARIDRHYFVRRYPWRPTSLDEQENPR